MTADVEVVRPLQRGWWENVLLVRVDGRLRARKELHRLDAPWARDVLIKEWRYLRELPASMRPPFVSVVDQCDELTADPPPADRRLWFDMEYIEGFTDVRALLAEGRVSVSDAARIQDLLIAALVDGLYRLPGEPFDPDRIVWPVIEQVVEFAVDDADLAPYAGVDEVTINGTVRPNLRQTLSAARADGLIREQFRAAPSVRLHGDLFYENVLYRPDPPAIRLIDPVSVAGVASGPVMFDRVKFASWLSGELYALRHCEFELDHDCCHCGGLSGAVGRVARIDYAWSSDDPVLGHLRHVDLGSRVLAAMNELCGPCEEAQAVLDAYFNLAMVPNTPMPQKLLRYARAVESLARWA